MIQVKKKLFDPTNLPGSSPEQRAGIRDIQYKYQHGKAPMIEKRDTKYRKMGKNLPYQESQGEQYEQAYGSYDKHGLSRNATEAIGSMLEQGNTFE